MAVSLHSGLSVEGGSFAGPVFVWPRAVVRCAKLFKALQYSLAPICARQPLGSARALHLVRWPRRSGIYAS
jgi:hypothetical protein